MVNRNLNYIFSSIICLNCAVITQYISFVCSVGIDVHQKLSLMRESNSIVLLKRNRKQASCPPAEEIYVIEDDNITVPHLPTKELCTLSVDKDSMLVIFP